MRGNNDPTADCDYEGCTIVAAAWRATSAVAFSDGISPASRHAGPRASAISVGFPFAACSKAARRFSAKFLASLVTKSKCSPGKTCTVALGARRRHERNLLFMLIIGLSQRNNAARPSYRFGRYFAAHHG